MAVVGVEREEGMLWVQREELRFRVTLVQGLLGAAVPLTWLSGGAPGLS